MNRIRLVPAVALLAVATGLAAAPAGAQTSTGRYAPERESRQSRWTLTAGAGVMTSGDLFSVPGTSVRNWLTPGGTEFGAQRFTVTLDEDLETTLGLIYLVARNWRLRLDLSYSTMDMTALARTAEAVDLVAYDRLTAGMVGLAIERALTATRSYPYLLAGGALTTLSSDRGDDFDQAVFGIRFGGGFHWALDPTWGLRMEVRDTIHQVDSSDHEVRLVGGGDPPPVEELGPQHFFEVGAALSITF